MGFNSGFKGLNFHYNLKRITGRIVPRIQIAMQLQGGNTKRYCWEHGIWCTNCLHSIEIPTRCSFVIEFIIPKFIEGPKCFKRHTAHHQELQTMFTAPSGLYTHVVTGRCQGWVGFSHSAWTTAGHHVGI